MVGIILLGSSMVFSIIHPIFIGKYVDGLSVDMDRYHIVTSILLLVVMWFLSVFVSYLNEINSAHMNIRLMYSMNFHLLQHAERLPLSLIHI